MTSAHSFGCTDGGSWVAALPHRQFDLPELFYLTCFVLLRNQGSSVWGQPAFA
jgi:hypothetical protein